MPRRIAILPDAVADFLLSHPERYEYIAPRNTEGTDAHAGRSD